MSQGSGFFKTLEHLIDVFEKNLLGFLLLIMVTITFAQVVARYLFNSGAIWALELTTTVFAWLILIGASHGIKVSAHLGVDVLLNAVAEKWQRLLAIIACLTCLLYASILLDASWLHTLSDNLNARGGALAYVQKMYQYDFPLEDLPIPRWIAYSALPIGLLLFIYRVLQVLYAIVTKSKKAIITSH